MLFIYLGFLFATDLVPTGTRSSAKKTSVNKMHFPNAGREYTYLHEERNLKSLEWMHSLRETNGSQINVRMLETCMRQHFRLF